VVTREQIKEMRARLAESRLELVEDIEARQLAVDLVGSRQARQVGEVIYKTRENGLLNGNGTSVDDPAAPGDVDTGGISIDLLNAIGDAMGAMKLDILDQVNAALAPLRDRIAVLEGQVSTLTALLSNGSTKLLSPPPT
jgi:hypothetical protein